MQTKQCTKIFFILRDEFRTKNVKVSNGESKSFSGPVYTRTIKFAKGKADGYSSANIKFVVGKKEVEVNFAATTEDTFQKCLREKGDNNFFTAGEHFFLSVVPVGSAKREVYLLNAQGVLQVPTVEDVCPEDGHHRISNVCASCMYRIKDASKFAPKAAPKQPTYRPVAPRAEPVFQVDQVAFPSLPSTPASSAPSTPETKQNVPKPSFSFGSPVVAVSREFEDFDEDFDENVLEDVELECSEDLLSTDTIEIRNAKLRRAAGEEAVLIYFADETQSWRGLFASTKQKTPAPIEMSFWETQNGLLEFTKSPMVIGEFVKGRFVPCPADISVFEIRSADHDVKHQESFFTVTKPGEIF
jgi:hypothetical protein